MIGGTAPVAVQSMTKTRTEDIRATVRQIRALERAGCELVRIAVPDSAAGDALPEIRKRVKLPLVADIHFDHRLALAAVRAGFDKVRINPGNIGAAWKVEEIIRAARDRGAAIRVGVNAGSTPTPTVDAMVESMKRGLEPFERLCFRDLVLSAKTTSIQDTIRIYRLLARRYSYPLHLGLTEAGLPFEGSIRTAAALGTLLLEGIGDTIRVSLTGSPVVEVVAAYELLVALGLRRKGPYLFSCPGCGRARVDIARTTRRVKRLLGGEGPQVRIAVMGCVVNGPGEARAADFGIACGGRRGALFAQGKVVKTGAVDRLVPELVRLAKSRR